VGPVQTVSMRCSFRARSKQERLLAGQARRLPRLLQGSRPMSAQGRLPAWRNWVRDELTELAERDIGGFTPAFRNDATTSTCSSGSVRVTSAITWSRVLQSSGEELDAGMNEGLYGERSVEVAVRAFAGRLGGEKARVARGRMQGVLIDRRLVL